MIKFLQSLKHALAGFRTVLRERNMRIHLAVAILVVVASFVLRINSTEWICISLSIGLVIALECVNTAIERVCDRVTMEDDPLIRQAKDVAASAVLVMAITSVITGLIVLLPKILEI